MCHVVWGLDILFEKLTPEIGVEFENHFCTQFLWDRGFHAKSESWSTIEKVVVCSWRRWELRLGASNE